jgi:predicted porin
MKYLALKVAVLGSFSSAAFAESNLSLYGVFDTAIRQETNVNANGDSKLSLRSGLIQGSRWGIRGKEDLGGGLNAIFNLEAGFNPVTGGGAQQGQLFSRQAWMGLDGNWGRLTFGRQFGVGFDAFGAFDPYGIGNAAQIAALQYDLFGARFDNTIKYRKKFGEWGFTAAYSFGESAGNSKAGTTLGTGLDYTHDAWTVNSAYQQSKDSNLKSSSAFVLGGTYSFGAAKSSKIYAGYTHNQRDQGFMPCANNNASSLPAELPEACVSAANPNGINGALSNTNLAPGSVSGDSKTDLYLIGAMTYLTPSWQLVGGYMQNNTKISSSPNARHVGAYAVLNYYFSKRTDVYASIDFNHAQNFEGGYNSLANGNRATRGLKLGMRHRF